MLLLLQLPLHSVKIFLSAVFLKLLLESQVLLLALSFLPNLKSFLGDLLICLLLDLAQLCLVSVNFVCIGDMTRSKVDDLLDALANEVSLGLVKVAAQNFRINRVL